MLKILSKSKVGASFLKNAALAIVIAGDATKSDVWIEDCSIASILIQLEAESLGLGSCWVQIRNRKYDEQIAANDYVRHHFNIPERLEVLTVVGIGYKAVEKPPYSENDLAWEKVYKNGYHTEFMFL
jgi:nitroreductase